ncbi:MAG: cell division protein ZapA [Kordiimonas sp.]|nr:cell division protein ZapA [Kordiimonas sp.]
MAQLHLTVGGQPYQLACKDGDEERLEQLAAQIDARMQQLIGVLGNVGERRLLLMTALQLADELGGAGAVAGESQGAIDTSSADDNKVTISPEWLNNMSHVLEDAVSRVNGVARRFEEIEE